MRLWSLHPSYLDTAGLTACWREGLLSRHVLLGLTKGYTHHPQLVRFQSLANPVAGIDTYLYSILQEAQNRNYKYDATKISYYDFAIKIKVADKQLEYEFSHLKKKLQVRKPDDYQRLLEVKIIQPHPMFRVEQGAIASWEILS